ncbi:MAG: CdaR family protein [Myxococcales bacterium]
MTAEATLRQRIKRMFQENLGLKVFSLAVSIGLFTVVHGAESGQRSFQVQVVAILPPASKGKVLVNKIPDKVSVKLSGSQSVINSIRSLESVQIDLTGAHEYYYFEPSLFGLPAGLDVQVTPPSLTLDWEARLERKLPVRVQLAGLANPNLELVSKPVVTPARISVSGPRSSVEQLKDLVTEPVSLSDLGPGTHRRHVPLLPLPENIAVTEGNEINVEITIDTKKEQRRLRHLEVAALGVNNEIVMRPAFVDVVVAAPQGVLDELNPEHLVPVVDLAGVNLGGGAVSVPVAVRGLAEGARVVRTEPADVLVRSK